MTLQQLAPLPSLVGLSRRAREHDRDPDRCSSICGNPMNLGSPSPRRRRPIAYEPFLLAPRRRRGMHCSLACRPTIPPRVGCARSAHSANAQRPEPKLLQSSPGGSSACRPPPRPLPNRDGNPRPLQPCSTTYSMASRAWRFERLTLHRCLPAPLHRQLKRDAFLLRLAESHSPPQLLPPPSSVCANTP